MNYDLPPIRKVGPAVLPKPKNIKIHAGRVIRLADKDSDKRSENSEFKSSLSAADDTRAAAHLFDFNFAFSAPKRKASQPTCMSLISVPHRARLVQIPDSSNFIMPTDTTKDSTKKEIDVHYQESSTSNKSLNQVTTGEIGCSYISDRNRESSLTTGFSSREGNCKNNFATSNCVNIPVVVTSVANQLRFPRKSPIPVHSRDSSSGTNQRHEVAQPFPNIVHHQQHSMISSSLSHTSSSPNIAYHHSTAESGTTNGCVTPSVVSHDTDIDRRQRLTNTSMSSADMTCPSRACTLSAFINHHSNTATAIPTTINVSSDGSTNRPTITITTTRGPHSPTLTATATSTPTGITGTNAGTFTYNIPIQHINQLPPTSQSPRNHHQNNHHSLLHLQNHNQNNHNQHQDNNFLRAESLMADHDQNGVSNTNHHTFTIPVNMTVSSNNLNSSCMSSKNTTSNSSNNNVNISLTSSPNSLKNNQQPKGSYLSSIPGGFIDNNNNSSAHETRSGSFPFNPNVLTDAQNRENEIDLLKDLFMKSAQHTNNSFKKTASGAAEEQQQQLNSTSFHPICLNCNTQILTVEHGLKAMDNTFHINCFTCSGCGNYQINYFKQTYAYFRLLELSLHEKHFYAIEHKPFCENCYMNLLEKCGICTKPITERILRATGKSFHPDCFCCVVCEKNLDGIPFTVDASSKVHCIDCYHKKYAPVCFICRMSIMPENGQETVRIVAMDHNFHIHCYKCEDCGFSFSTNSEQNGGNCFPLDNHIYCKSCMINRVKTTTTCSMHHSGLTSARAKPNNLAPRSTDL